MTFDREKLTSLSLPLIRGIFHEPIPQRTFDQIARRFAATPGTVVLKSGTDLDCARYNLLAIDPWLTFRAKGRECAIGYEQTTTRFRCDPFDLLQALVDHFTLGFPKGVKAFGPGALSPVMAGFFGYFGYDLKQHIETLAVTCMDTDLPDLCLYAPSAIVVEDRVKTTTTLVVPRLVSRGQQRDDGSVRKVRNRFFAALDAPGNDGDLGFQVDTRGLQSNFTRSAYVDAVLKIIEYIRAGDIYQVNLSQRFEAGFHGSPFALFQQLFSKNPAPFFAFVNAGDHQIVSTSPERFLHQQGRSIETRPIKGTFPRGETPEADLGLRQGLEQSLKDDAELSMIVDLMRNDLGKVAEGGSVRLAEHRRIEAYANVFHLVSIVTAELERTRSCVDLLRATFPGGSITGCPKKRSMEIIDELESVNRHVYTGSLGYLSFHHTLDLSIAIRTATIARDRICFSVGGGIVFDSVPEREFQETLDKGRTLMETLEQEGEKTGHHRPWAWVCGTLVPEDEAMVPALCPGFQHGAGIFETLGVKNGQPLLLKAHLSRFYRSWQELFKTSLPEITWGTVIDQLVEANGFDRGTFALKLVAADQGGGRSPFLAAFIRPHVHRLAATGKKGFDLVTFPSPRTTPLADHKSLNYHYYLLAARFAGQNRADEALILNPDGSVSETNTCSLMAVNKKIVTLPLSPHVLPGVTQAVLVRGMERSGYRFVKQPMTPGAFFASGKIVLTNALVGAVPALSLDGRRLEPHSGLCEQLNRLLWA